MTAMLITFLLAFYWCGNKCRRHQDVRDLDSSPYGIMDQMPEEEILAGHPLLFRPLRVTKKSNISYLQKLKRRTVCAQNEKIPFSIPSLWSLEGCFRNNSECQWTISVEPQQCLQNYLEVKAFNETLLYSHYISLKNVNQKKKKKQLH